MDLQTRFLADVMLGSLAKWLRILGFDAEYDNRITDDQLVHRALEEVRIVLTRDRRLAQRRLLRGRCLLILNTPLRSQILQVIAFLGEGFDPALMLTRCLECNQPLLPVARRKIAREVPAYVYRTRRNFKRCPCCNRVYWKGTHRDRILERLLGIPSAPDDPGCSDRPVE